MIAVALVLHYLADFLLQPRWMAKEKSIKFRVLLQHLSIHSLVFSIGLAPFGLYNALIFSGWNIIFHGIIDWYIWRGYKSFVLWRLKKGRDISLMVNQEWRYWEDKWFYDTIGFDGLLHALTLVLLSNMLFN